MHKGYKIGDKVTGESNCDSPLALFIGKTATVLEVKDNMFQLECPGVTTLFWDITEQFRLAKCPVCNMDPCACDDDEELGKNPQCDFASDGFCCTHYSMACYVKSEQFDKFTEAVKPKHKPFPTQALTSWPSIHSKMEVAKHLNELKDE